MDAPCLVKTYRGSNAYRGTSIISLVRYTRRIYMVGMVGMVIFFLKFLNPALLQAIPVAWFLLHALVV